MMRSIPEDLELDFGIGEGLHDNIDGRVRFGHFGEVGIDEDGN